MNRLIYLSVVAIWLCCSGCVYPSISGKVVDAETGKPIAGALILAQWTTTHGFGLSYHKVYKTVETETDAEGQFHIEGVYNPRVNAPTLVIYKDNYVAWRNDYIYPDYRNRSDFMWKNRVDYKLEKLNSKVVAFDFESFVMQGIMTEGMHDMPKIYYAINNTNKR